MEVGGYPGLIIGPSKFRQASVNFLNKFLIKLKGGKITLKLNMVIQYKNRLIVQHIKY